MNILKQQEIVKLQIGKIMHDLHHGKFQYQYYDIPSVQTVHSYETRCKSNMNYHQTQAMTEISQRSLTCIGSKVWRTVPRDIKNLSANAFKARYKAYLINQYG